VRTRALAGLAADLAAVVVAVLASLVAAAPARAADDAFAWAPAHAPSVAQGRQSSQRFGLVGLTEVEVEVEDLYDAANREALALAEQRIGAVPGVRAVFGPAGLLDVTVDGSGKPSARSVLSRGPNEAQG
jgi:predicted RND superfamily exporter protein